MGTASKDLVMIGREIDRALAAHPMPAAAGVLIAQSDLVGRAWSGSNLGYHAYVYYEGFHRPPADRAFDPVRGLPGQGELGSDGWLRLNRQYVFSWILEQSGSPDLDLLRATAAEAERVVDDCRAQLAGLLAEAGDQARDGPSNLLGRLQAGRALSYREVRDRLSLPGQVATRDPAWDGSWVTAPHQEVWCAATSVRSPFLALVALAGILDELRSSEPAARRRGPAIPPAGSTGRRTAPEPSIPQTQAS